MLSFLFISSVLAEDDPDLLLEEVGAMTTTFQSQIESVPSALRENNRRHLARGLSLFQ